MAPAMVERAGWEALADRVARVQAAQPAPARVVTEVLVGRQVTARVAALGAPSSPHPTPGCSGVGSSTIKLAPVAQQATVGRAVMADRALSARLARQATVALVVKVAKVAMVAEVAAAGASVSTASQES